MKCHPINRPKMHPEIQAAIDAASVERYYSGYLVSGVPGYEDIEDEDGTVLVQVDYDFPSLASSLGWSLAMVQRTAKFEPRCILGHTAKDHEAMGWTCDEHVKPSYAGPVRFLQAPSVKGCQHSNTDGTVDCKDCGCTAGDFIAGAAEFLDNF